MIHDLPQVHPSWRAPDHLTRLKIEHRRFPSVLIFESLPSGLKIDHHPVHIVLVEFSRHLPKEPLG
jgi:hypothetical protein